MYVSSQHTDNIIRYFPQLETLYQPVPFPPAILNDMNVGDMFYGTFVQFGLRMCIIIILILILFWSNIYLNCNDDFIQFSWNS